MSYYGDIRLGDTIDIKFATTAATTGAPTTLSGTPVISAYPGNSTTQLTAGITLTVDFDTVTGLNNVRVVATSGNGYATATNYMLVITTGTVGGTSAVGYCVASFSIENRSALMPTTAARTLVVDAAGLADANTVKVGPTGAGTAQTARDIGASVLLSAGTGTGQLDFTSGVVKANLAQILGTALTETAGQIAAAFKQFFNIASPTSTMNTITTVTTTTTATNLTNAATAGDLTATMKTSVENAVWDAVLTGASHNNATSAGKRLRQLSTITTVDSSVNDAAATTTSFVTALSSAVNDFYKDQTLIFTSGALSGQSRIVTAYNGTTKAITLDEALTSAPANADTFTLWANHTHTLSQVSGAVWDESRSIHTTAGTFGEGVASVQGNVTGSTASVTGAVGSVTGAVGSVTGNVGGNVVGSVASVSGAVGSVTGNVGGNVVGSVGSVTGAVGSVTGNVGGNVTGSVGSVVAAVAITSNVKKNQALAKVEFVMTDSTNHNPKTGLTVTVTRSIDGGAFAAGTLSAVTEVANGIYSVDFGSGDMNGNVIVLQATAAAADTSFVNIITQP